MSTRSRRPTPVAASSALAGGALGILLAALPGCADRDFPRNMADRDVDQAVATLKPTVNRRAWGTIKFEAVDDGVRVHADVNGLTPGLHAFHVHETGDCSAPDASSAGKHFNFDTAQQPREITGNLGELEVGSTGRAVFEGVIPRAELEGERTIVGRAVVVHERGNDPDAAPDGNAGAPVACGVIASSRDMRS